MVETGIVFIKIAPLVFIATLVAGGGESIVPIAPAGMLLGEISAAEVVVLVLVFKSVIFGAEMAGVQVFGVIVSVAVLLAEKLVSVLGGFQVVSKSVGVKLINGAPCTDERVRGADCVSVIVVKLEWVVV